MTTTIPLGWAALEERLPAVRDALTGYLDGVDDPSSLSVNKVDDPTIFCGLANGVNDPTGLVVFMGSEGEIGDPNNAPRIPMNMIEEAVGGGEVQALILIDYSNQPGELVVLFCR